jgi:hypothetical protein
MNLCPDCQRAESDPLHAVYTPALCCRARAVATTPRRFQRQAFDAATYGLSAEDAHDVRVRAHALINASKAKEPQA